MERLCESLDANPRIVQASLEERGESAFTQSHALTHDILIISIFVVFETRRYNNINISTLCPLNNISVQPGL